VNHEPHAGGVEGDTRDAGQRRSRLRHWLVMFACCVPMLAIVGVLVATGALGFGAAIVALLCVALMPLLHGGSHGHGGGGHRG
jgi:ABC-type proline/glycine betaine transport system permease subunit